MSIFDFTSTSSAFPLLCPLPDFLHPPNESYVIAVKQADQVMSWIMGMEAIVRAASCNSWYLYQPKLEEGKASEIRSSSLNAAPSQ